MTSCTHRGWWSGCDAQAQAHWYRHTGTDMLVQTHRHRHAGSSQKYTPRISQHPLMPSAHDQSEVETPGSESKLSQIGCSWIC